MALTIIQQPQALTFVGNIPDLIAQTDGLGMTVNVSKGTTLILSEHYTADEGGLARVSLKDFLDDQLQLELPAPDADLFEQTKSWASFSVEIISGESTETISFVAIKGGSSTLNLDCPAYLLEAWLTWQPQIKKVKDIQPEWLSYFTQHAAVVKARGYFTGGTSEDVTLHTLDAGKHYTINMTFSDLRAEFVEQPIYIDVWVENAPEGDPVFSTYRQRYVLSTEYFEFDDFFLFKNSVGGLDLIRFTGSKESTNPIDIDSALYYDEYQRDYQVTPSLAFEKNTGYFRSRAELLWSLDFFQAKEKYYQIEDEFTEIRLINPEFTAPENTLTSLDFKFSYTRQSLYLSLFKKKSPLIDPVIIGPGDDDYYLPPDIGGFPQQTDPSGLLFPVQKPGTPGWFFITWENMLAEILENIPSGNHNELDGLQGGDPEQEEYFHLTAEEREGLQELLSPPSIDRISKVGTISFTSPTALDALGWKAVFSDVELDATPLSISGITGTPVDYDRGDALYYKPDGTLGYITGIEDPEGTPLPPAIPSGTLRMADILRKPTGENIIDLITEQTSDFVSKSEENLQTIASLLAFSKLARTEGAPQRVPNISMSGILSLPSSPAINDVYSTVEGVGATDWSKLVTINIAGGQLRYFVILEFAGVSPNFEKGDVWIQFQTDGSGTLTVNKLKVFGEINPAKLKLVRLDSTTYGVFVHHNEPGAFFKFRPQHHFGSSSVYIYHHQDGRNPLPVGDEYDFELYGDLSEILSDIAALETWAMDLDNQVDDHEERISDLETRPYIEDIIAGANITIDKTDPANPIISSTGGGGGGSIPYLTDLDTWPSLKFDKNYRYTHEMAGPVTILAEFVTPTAIVGNLCKLYIKANGADKPDFEDEKFEIIWDNWVNTAGHWNRFFAEYSPEGKVILQIEQAHLGTANDGSGLTQLTITFEDNHVQTHIITNSTEIVIDSTGAQFGYKTILYIKADGANKPFWDSADVVVTYDDYLNVADVWNRIILEWRPESKAIMQLINT